MTSPSPGTRSLPDATRRVEQIDVLKGIAMVAVIFLHAMPAHELFDSAAQFWIGQAVPVFVVIMGLNGGMSFARAGAVTLRELFPPGYVRRRIDRLWVPFALLFAAALVVALVRGEASPRQLSGLATGVLPVGGPGNYFVTFVFQYAVAFPVVYWCFRRALWASALAACAIGAAFELVAPHVAAFDTGPYYYVSSFLHWLPFLAAGLVLAHWMVHRDPVPIWGWALAALSAAHLVIVSVDASVLPWSIPGWREWGQTFAGAPYAAGLVAAGLLWLPRTVPRGLRWVATVGRRSYEIFLLQILWFALVPERGLLMIVPDLLACLGLGTLASLTLDHARAAIGASTRRSAESAA